ncbi:hypothetical protein G1K46_06180 [Tenacibaculum finnmarkense]|uniref:hypothetical protein n=1 Tax=Tenacibaculum finnmarkense TaxID=2781243 RepID=UPI001EFAF766|nr:hypothetical protein [Tenacibaculum finnmarkense]MCG8732591.1 hypothetical protein [Tenacibaculum finnmarkense]MCG8748642.1 hypothetical protein [Tenacibaculum finnmarkense]MCG8753460.1 hypothetical protein [Tenacibaculum finnmarkense]MCG8762330.1 hypothetical protein [Tenacibaculum finnmarkense]MCG8782297.1 hypothetical protein [Tenacibaculum finnmarkense]
MNKVKNLVVLVLFCVFLSNCTSVEDKVKEYREITVKIHEIGQEMNKGTKNPAAGIEEIKELTMKLKSFDKEVLDLYSAEEKIKSDIEKEKNSVKASAKKNKILVTYNQAISEHKKAVSKIKLMLKYAPGMSQLLEYNWRQKAWDTMAVHYNIKKLKGDFRKEFGEDEFNKLILEIDQNWNRKM